MSSSPIRLIFLSDKKFEEVAFLDLLKRNHLFREGEKVIINKQPNLTLPLQLLSDFSN